jgi:phosphoribosylaminoimidazole carboxylase (NCAIR synthetase)
MTMPTVVILGGNDMACPAIERIVELGYRVIVLDGSAQAPAARISHTFLNVDFSNVDAVREALAPFSFDGNHAAERFRDRLGRDDRA